MYFKYGNESWILLYFNSNITCVSSFKGKVKSQSKLRKLFPSWNVKIFIKMEKCKKYKPTKMSFRKGLSTENMYYTVARIIVAASKW